MLSKLKKSLARIAARKQFNDSRSKTAFSPAPVKPIRRRICPVCGKNFITTNSNHKYCCGECAFIHHRETYNARYQRERKLRAKDDPLEGRICKTCGKTFDAVHRLQRYCSPKCRKNFYTQNHGKTFEKTCVVCGKTFTTRHPLKKCCSDECSYTHRIEIALANKRRLYERLAKTKPLEGRICKYCKRTFTANVRQQKFCSVECRKQFRLEANRCGPVEKTCIVCGKTFSSYIPQKNTCSTECADKLYHSRQKKPSQKEYQCRKCGKIFQAEHDGKHVFCSAECRLNFYKRNPLRPKKFCLHCGKEFSYDPADKVKEFCSLKCEKAHASKTAFSSTPKKQKKSLEQWQREATQCGMTYGQYRAMVEKFGKTFDELKLTDFEPREEENIIEIKL